MTLVPWLNHVGTNISWIVLALFLMSPQLLPHLLTLRTCQTEEEGRRLRCQHCPLLLIEKQKLSPNVPLQQNFSLQSERVEVKIRGCFFFIMKIGKEEKDWISLRTFFFILTLSNILIIKEWFSWSLIYIRKWKYYFLVYLSELCEG